MPKIGFRHSVESKRRMSRSRTGPGNGMWGKKHSPETLAKMSAKARGRRASIETRRRQSESRKGMHAGSKHPMWGKHHSAESREKTSKSMKQVWADPIARSRMVRWFHTEPGRKHLAENGRKAAEHRRTHGLYACKDATKKKISSTLKCTMQNGLREVLAKIHRRPAVRQRHREAVIRSSSGSANSAT